MAPFKAKILIIGPANCGKTRLANFLCDLNIILPDDAKAVTKGIRILEYDLTDIEINGQKSDVDVQLWDVTGNDIYSTYWPVFRRSTDGIVFVYSQEDDMGVRKLDLMYNYFVTQPNLSLRACLVCAMHSDEVNAKLSSTFSKVSQVVVNLDTQGEKFKQDFSKYVVSVVNTLSNK